MLILTSQIDYAAVASDLGITKNAVKLRFYRLRTALEKTDSPPEGETVEEESMDAVMAEPRASTPAEEKDSSGQIEAMEEA